MFPSQLTIGNKTYKEEEVIISDIPSGYSVYRVKDWSDPYMQSIGYSAYIRNNIGQFQVVSPYIFDAQGNYCGTLSSNTNFSRMTRSDVFKLANHQLLDFGYKWGLSESEIISLLNVTLPDGYTLKQKMNYMIWTNNRWGGQMRSNGDWWDYLKQDGRYVLDRDGKKQEVEVQMIAIVHGGQKILASNETEEIFGVPMRKIIPFKRSDWGKHYDTHPYLMQRVTVASTPNNGYGEFPKGHVYCPAVLDNLDFQFYNRNFKPASHRIPDAQMTKI